MFVKAKARYAKFKYDGVDDESVETVVRRVKAAALAQSRIYDYDLSNFTFEKTVANIYPTLLALVSQWRIE